jgi:hypothetical protein
MTATNKRLLLSESRGDSNRCTPCWGENPTNTTRTLPTPAHVCPAYASCGRSLYVTTFHGTPTDLGISHCSREKGLLTQSTARRLTDPWVRTQLLSWSNQWSRGRKLSSWRWPTTRFIGPISPACDRYVQYLLMGDNRTVLNWPRRRLQPWGCWLATCPLPDLLNQLFPLSPKGHARSPF